MIASFWEIALEHVVSFAGGVLVGFVASSRYRIVKRSGKEPE